MFFRLSPSGAKVEKNILRDRIPRGRFSYHGILSGAFPSRGKKAGLTNVVQFAFKNSFFRLSPHRGETKKHPWDRNSTTVGFHTTAFCPWGLEKPRAKCRGMKPKPPSQLRFKTGFFSTFAPIGAKVEKNTVSERNWTTFVFIPRLFALGLGKAQGQKCRGMKPNLRGIAIKNGCFFDFRPDRGRSRKKHRFERNWTTFGFIPRLFALGLWESPGRNAVVWKLNLRGIAILTRVFSTFPRSGRKVEITRF